MGQTAADVLIDTIHDWGVEVVFGLPGDGINGIMEALRKRQDRDPLRPGAPRGGGRVHGLRLRQVHRQARRLPGHLRARRHPSAERPLRRQARRPAGARHHRPSLPRPDRHLRAAGRRPRPGLRRRRRLQHPGDGRRARRERRGPGLPHGARAIAASPTSTSRSTSRSMEAGKPLEAQRAGTRIRRLGPRRAAAGADDDLRARPPTCSNAGKTRGHPGRPRRARRHRRAGAAGRAARRADRQAAARQGGGARRQPVHHRRHRPARHPPVAGGAGGVRHAAHGRHVLPLHRVPAQARARRARYRSTSTRPASACATRSRSAWSATAGATLRALLPAAASATSDRGFLEKAQEGMRDWWELMEERGTRRGQADEAAGRGLGAGQAPRADDAIVVAATPAPSPPGWPARSRVRAGRCTRSRARSPRWPTACRTRSPRRSPIRTASASPSSATAASRCSWPSSPPRQVPAADQGGHHQEQLARA